MREIEISEVALVLFNFIGDKPMAENTKHNTPTNEW
jgi:hypothetical protein